MFPWLAKEQSSLQDPKTRGNMKVNPADRVVFSSRETFSSVDYKILLDEVQRVERSIYKLKKNAGIKMIPCGESRDGIISGGSIEHIVEHAVCAVMDLISPIDEASCGITEDVGWSGEFRRRNYNVSVSPPHQSLQTWEFKLQTKLLI